MCSGYIGGASYLSCWNAVLKAAVVFPTGFYIGRDLLPRTRRVPRKKTCTLPGIRSPRLLSMKAREAWKIRALDYVPVSRNISAWFQRTQATCSQCVPL